MKDILGKLKASYIPMTEATFLVLASFRAERYGYAAAQAVSQMTGGRVKLGTGTVYTIISKLLKDKMIEVVKEDDRRKIYRITALGELVLKEEAKRLTELSLIAGDILR
ncbi:MAG: helix-turn-helix transcriptional regulator [Oscillospiraceae bacterium]|nr:helix-turn-helix transcriptional regulator [Oscillospiraceae bacterium]